MDEIQSYIQEHREKYVERLHDFLRIPCISTLPDKADDIRRAATWVRDALTDAGADAEIMETGGWPCVVGDTGPAGGGPTILVYGHFDVQPVGNLDLWDSGPFEPDIRDGRLYARGAADDKGQLLTHILAVEAWKKAEDHWPLRVKFIIEGEEEIGSPNLMPFITKHADRLACDYVVISDTAMFDANTPAITYGTKGLVYKQINVSGPQQDLHSGAFGGTIANPANALATVLAGLKNADGRITIPGFYEKVREPSPEEQAEWDKLPFDEQTYLESLGSPALDGETGYSTLVRRWARPTLDVNGLFGGFAGEGASTIIPARCGAKVSMRLVPDQEPDEISRLFDDAVRALTPPTVELTIQSFAGAAPYVCPIDSSGVRAAAAAIDEGFGTPPVFVREGGTLPILPEFRRILGADSILMGFCVPNCNAHGPNEFLVVEDFWAGIRTSALLLRNLAE